MGLEADDGRPETSPPPRRGVQTADRAVVRERQAIPGDQGRARHRAIDPAAPGPGHPRQRLRPGRAQPHARAERAGRAGEAQQAVGDGGGRFRTSGAGIRTKAGVIRANAARYPISARCGILGVPRSTCYWMTGHPGTERADPIAGDVRAVRRDGRERYGARKIKAALERRGVTASRRRIGGIMREQGMTGAYARGRSEPHRTRADEAGLANLPDPRVRRLRPAHASGGRPDVCEGRERMGVRVSAGRPGGQGHRRPFRRADPGREPGAGRVRHPRLPADGRPGNRGLPAGRVRRPLFPYSDVRRQQHAGGSCERDGTNQRRVPRGGRAIRGARRHNRRRAWNDEKRLARFRRTVDSRNGMRRNGLRNGLPAGPRRARSYC
ncbi:transposase [Bifidobacterium adolescentis]|nr:transposase [Bifidobacterium adolescentis]